MFLSNNNQEEDQLCHLRLADPELPIYDSPTEYAETASRLCPVGVYEVVEENNSKPLFHINLQRLVHGKAYDIKDPAQDISGMAPANRTTPTCKH